MLSQEKEAGNVFIRAEDLSRVSAEILKAHGLTREDALLVADCLVQADLRGVETHGITRLVHYCKRVSMGLIKARPNITIELVTPVAASVDGDDGFGFVVATRAMETAIDIAKKYGIGLAAVRRSNHFGMAATYVLQAIDAGYMSMVFTNASIAMPPWGGREPLLGTSPFAAGAPGGKLPPFVLDMSPAVAARGKIRLAAKRGEQVPLGWGLDKGGKASTDPNVLLDGGVVLPMGGPKGSALSMMMDIFGGVFTGSAYGGDVTNHAEEFTRPQNVGHFMLAIKPDLFMSRSDFVARMDELTRRVKSCALADGFSEIMVAGEMEGRLEARRRVEGIMLPVAEINAIRALGDKHGIPFPKLSTVPHSR